MDVKRVKNISNSSMKNFYSIQCATLNLNSIHWCGGKQSLFCGKCGHNKNKTFKEKESIKILKIFWFNLWYKCVKYNTLWLWTKFWWIIKSLYFLPVWIYLVRGISFQSKYNRKVWKLLKPYWFCPKVGLASFGWFLQPEQ